MATTVGFIGFGEAGQTFSADPRWSLSCSGFDTKLRQETGRAGKLADFARCKVRADETDAVTLSGASVCLSLVTADQSAAAAESAARCLAPRTLFLDMNSVAPDTKRQSARVIEAAGGRYADVAIMAPVQPLALSVPLLVSGPWADEAVRALKEIGFTSVTSAGGEIGRASSIKMIRSVMIKGIEALTAECLLAAAKAGVVDEVLDSLGAEWRTRANYNLERMLVHGGRRAAEMEEVARTLHHLGIVPLMTAGTIQRQRGFGAFRCAAERDTLDGKLAAILGAGGAAA